MVDRARTIRATVSPASTASNSGITVSPARSAADRRRFVRFPWRVYRGIDAWVPPLISDFKKKLDTVRNPFYEHAEIELFLARRNGAVAGTVAAIIDHHYNSFHEERTGFFGFFEAVNDDAVAGALIDAAALVPAGSYSQARAEVRGRRGRLQRRR